MFESAKDPVLQEDLEVVANANLPWEAFAGKSVLVTGATGLIGSQVVKALACRNRLYHSGIRILALVRNEAKAKVVFADLENRPEIKFVVGDVNKPLLVQGSVDFIVHGASVTSSKDFVTKPVETITTVLDGTRHALELALEKTVKGFLFLSSLEVYGVTNPESPSVCESVFGYLDPMQVRSSYPEAKRLAECLCASYAREFGVPVVVARLSQTFGAGVAYDDGRVFAQFARAVIEKKDIVLCTLGETERNYCYTADAVTAILWILAKGKSGEAYNVANKDTAISIADMAQLVARAFPESGIKVTFKIAKDACTLGYNPTVKIRLNAEKLEALGWVPNVGIREMFHRLIQSMGLQKENIF